MLRRELLKRTALALAAGAIASDYASSEGLDSTALGQWGAVRAQFALSDEFIHMSAMLLSSHPRPVREAIEQHRRALDTDPLTYVFQKNHLLQNAARVAAGQYFGLDTTNVALTDSTTMGVALVYNGLRLGPDQEILSTNQDYYVTHEAIRLASERTAAKVRKISLYEDIDGISEEQIVDRISAA